MFLDYFTVIGDAVHSMVTSILMVEDPTKYQTEEDRAIIRKLIEDYITDKRTIILSVGPFKE